MRGSFGEKGVKPRINLNRGDVPGGSAQGVRQEASAWADLEDGISGCKFRECDDLANDVRVDKKVLSQPSDWRRGRR
jgi:hypothetical protein